MKPLFISLKKEYRWKCKSKHAVLFFFITSDCICKIWKSVIKWICKCVWILTTMCFPLPSVRLIHIHSHSLQWAHKSQKQKLFLAIYHHHSAITWNINKPGSFHLQTAFLHLKFLGYLIWFRLIFSAKMFSQVFFFSWGFYERYTVYTSYIAHLQSEALS